MPRLYISTDEYLQHPLAQAGGWTFGTQSVLAPGVLDGMIARASARVDSECRRRFGFPGTTSLANPCNTGDTSVDLVSLLNLDAAPAMLLQIGTGGTMEIVQVGGQTQSQPTAPYGGTCILFPGVIMRYNHLAGETVQGYWYEQENVRGGATSSGDQYWDLTQEGQIAMAHAPRMGMTGVIRTVFLRNMPVLSINSVSITYPWTNGADLATPAGLAIANMEGWYRFPVGSYVPEDSIITTAYLAGYLSIPDDVKLAVLYEVAAELALARNPYGAFSFHSGVRSTTFGQAGKIGRSLTLFSQEASGLLAPYKNLVIA